MLRIVRMKRTITASLRTMRLLMMLKSRANPRGLTVVLSNRRASLGRKTRHSLRKCLLVIREVRSGRIWRVTLEWELLNKWLTVRTIQWRAHIMWMWGKALKKKERSWLFKSAWAQMATQPRLLCTKSSLLCHSVVNLKTKRCENRRDKVTMMRLRVHLLHLLIHKSQTIQRITRL